MSAMTVKEFLHLAEVAASRMAKGTSFWWADRDDLKSEAVTAMLSANYDPKTGVAPEAFYWKVCVYALRRYLWRNSSPVSGGSHRPEESYIGLRRAMIDTGVHEDGEAPRGAVLVDSAPTADALVDEMRWTMRALVAIGDARDAEHTLAHDPELYALAQELRR